MITKELSYRIEQAFQQVNRRHFMPPTIRDMAAVDRALPIGFGQTISQPYTVRNMLLWLAPAMNQRILDLGSGSGWTAALLAYLAGPEGMIHAVERIPELKTFGENNCRAFGGKNIEFHLAGRTIGLPSQAPYDRILVSAAADKDIPPDLLQQLAANGKMVIPVGHSIVELKMDADGGIAYRRDHHGYSFVPLVVPDDDTKIIK